MKIFVFITILIFSLLINKEIKQSYFIPTKEIKKIEESNFFYTNLEEDFWKKNFKFFWKYY